MSRSITKYVQPRTKKAEGFLQIVQKRWTALTFAELHASETQEMLNRDAEVTEVLDVLSTELMGVGEKIWQTQTNGLKLTWEKVKLEEPKA